MNNPYLEIGGRSIGIDFEPLVIAEIGINHGGSLAVAKTMVDTAHAAGCEIIKHQTHIVDDEMSSAAKKVVPGNSENCIYDIIANCALDEDEEVALKEYIEAKDMLFISTPFSRAAADRLQRMGVSAYKIGSGECNHYPLVAYVAAFGKPMIVSTGMNDIPSIAKTVNIMEQYSINYALLHCTNVYPTPPQLVRLGAIKEMQTAFPNAVIGLSDHTQNNYACLAAVAMGACILERHFTDDKNRQGEDIICSMDPTDLAGLIAGSKEIALMRGGKKMAVEAERVTIDFAFATVVAIEEIKPGEKLSTKNTWAKRPGTGEIPAAQLTTVLGKTAKTYIPKNEHIKWCDIEFSPT